MAQNTNDTNPANSSLLLLKLLGTNADSELVADMARSLPAHASAPGSASVLRKAIERDGYGERFNFAQLQILAGFCAQGPDAAWKDANAPESLARLVLRKLSGRASTDASSELALKAIELAPLSDLGESFGLALIQASGPARLGFSPFFSWARRSGRNPFSFRFEAEHSYEGQLVIGLSPNPEVFDLIVSSGVDPRQDELGKPLWESMRDMARSRCDSASFAKIDSWAAIHESASEVERKLADYFSELARYGGENILRSRKDWHEVRDAQGRTAMMALAESSSSSVKAWWDVKKAFPASSVQDHEGRSLWHYLFAKGKNAPPGIANFLNKNCPLVPDAQGRGLLPSVAAMRDSNGRRRSDHEWFFAEMSMLRATTAKPLAKDWLGCDCTAQALEFADWLANERYISDKGLTRSSDLIAKLCKSLNPDSFAALDQQTLGALAFNLAMSSSALNPANGSDLLVERLLGFGGHCVLSAQRQEALDKRAPPHLASMINQAFGAARSRAELGALVPDPSARTPRHAQSI